MLRHLRGARELFLCLLGTSLVFLQSSRHESMVSSAANLHCAIVNSRFKTPAMPRVNWFAKRVLRIKQHSAVSATGRHLVGVDFWREAQVAIRNRGLAVTWVVGIARDRQGAQMISDAAIQVFKSASIQPRFLTLTRDDVTRLEFLASQVKEILDRGVARDDTPEWLKTPLSTNGAAK
jgi:hypothetical protein